MKYTVRIIDSVIVFLVANIPIITGKYINPWWAVLLLVGFVFINIVPSFYNRTLPRKKLRVCANGRGEG